MEKETPYEKKLRELKEAYEKEVAEAKKEYQEDIESAMKETPTVEEWGEEFDKKYKDFVFFDSHIEELKQFIRSLLSSHDAELRRKIEGMKKDDVEDESVETREQAVHIIQNRACNKTLDAVLALLSTKK